MSEEKSPADKPEAPKSAPSGGTGGKGAAKDEKSVPNALAKDAKPADANAAKSAVPSVPQKDATPAYPPKKGAGGSFFAGFFGGLIGGAVIIGGVGASAYIFQQQIRDIVLQPEMAGINQTVQEQAQKTSDRIATLEKVVVIAQGALREQAQTVAKLGDQIAANRTTEGSSGSRPLAATDDSALRALDRRLNDASADIAALKDAIARSQKSGETPVRPAAVDDSALRALDRRLNDALTDIAALKDAIARIQKSIPPEGALMRLTERAEQTETAFRTIAQQRNGVQALLLVVGQLRISVDSGQAFSSELAIAKRFTPAEQAGLLDILGQYAATGVTPRQILAETFITAQDAAIVANRTAKEGDIWGKVLEQASRLVQIRNTSAEGDGTNAIVARAGAALRMNDLELAVREMNSLPATPRAAADSWIKAAEARIRTDRALNDLTNIAIAASVTGQTTN